MSGFVWIILGISLWFVSGIVWIYNSLGNKAKPGPKKYSFNWWLSSWQIIPASSIFVLVWLVNLIKWVESGYKKIIQSSVS